MTKKLVKAKCYNYLNPSNAAENNKTAIKFTQWLQQKHANSNYSYKPSVSSVFFEGKAEQSQLLVGYSVEESMYNVICKPSFLIFIHFYHLHSDIPVNHSHKKVFYSAFHSTGQQHLIIYNKPKTIQI